MGSEELSNGKKQWVESGPRERIDYREWNPVKMSLEERSERLGNEDLRVRMEEYTEELRKRLMDAFGASPSEEQIQDAPNQLRNHLLMLARYASHFAMHHDNYRVGSVMLALRRTEHANENPWVIVFSANTKIDEHGVPTADAKKWCGEQYLMDYAADPKNQISRIVSFTVVGPPRPDDVSVRKGIRQITLTCCSMCRDRMTSDEFLCTEENPIIVPETTEVYTMDPEKPYLHKVQRVKDLHPFHQELRPGLAETD